MNISIIGLGYLGLTAAACLSRAGHKITGIDNNKKHIDLLNQGIVTIHEPGLSELITQSQLENNIRFIHTDNFLVKLDDVVVITVSTPELDDGCVDLSQIETSLDWINQRKNNNTVLIMKSTVPPGTGNMINEKTDNIYVSNPEFLREGQAVYDWMNPDRIVIGTDNDEVISIIKEIYNNTDTEYFITDITSSEMIKYTSNAFLATKISFINEIALLCDCIGASIDDVSIGLSLDSRNGKRLHAGVGYGGSCLPKDVKGLINIGHEYFLNLELLKTVESINKRQAIVPLNILKDFFNGDISGLNVGILGISFKPNTNDIRNSQSLALIDKLLKEPVNVRIYDPFVLTNNIDLDKSICVYDSIIDMSYDCNVLILMTEWSEFLNCNWTEIFINMEYPYFMIDGRNALNQKTLEHIGFNYIGIGRA